MPMKSSSTLKQQRSLDDNNPKTWDPLWKKILDYNELTGLATNSDIDHKYVRVDNQGHAGLVTLDKHEIVFQLGIRYRDLIAIAPSLLYPSPASILIRDRAILANLEATRVIITSHEVYVLSVPKASDPTILTLASVDHPFVKHLKCCLKDSPEEEECSSPRGDHNHGGWHHHHHNRPLTTTTSTAALAVPHNSLVMPHTPRNIATPVEEQEATITAADAAAQEEPLEGQSQSQQETRKKEEEEPRRPSSTTQPQHQQEQGRECRESMPFELRALEVALRVCFGVIESEVSDLEERATAAIEGLLHNIGREVLESVRGEKNAADRLRARIERIQQEIDEILSDDLDMRDLYLSRKEEEFGYNDTEHQLLAPLFYTMSESDLSVLEQPTNGGGGGEDAYWPHEDRSNRGTAHRHTNHHGNTNNNNNDSRRRNDGGGSFAGRSRQPSFQNLQRQEREHNDGGGSDDGSCEVQYIHPDDSSLLLPLDMPHHHRETHQQQPQHQKHQQRSNSTTNNNNQSNNYQRQTSSSSHRHLLPGWRRKRSHRRQEKQQQQQQQTAPPFAPASDFVFNNDDDDDGVGIGTTNIGSGTIAGGGGGDGSSSSIASFSSSDALKVNPDDIQEAEDLLECFHILADGIFHRLRIIDERIDDTEDLLEIELDHRRNQIFTLNLVVSTISMSFGYFAAISGMFGMNLYNSMWSDIGWVFALVMVLLVTGTVGLFLGTMVYVKRKGLLFIPT